MGRADDLAAIATTSYRRRVEAREQWEAEQLARLPVDDRPAAATWLTIHGVLPPWYADRLTPEAGS